MLFACLLRQGKRRELLNFSLAWAPRRSKRFECHQQVLQVFHHGHAKGRQIAAIFRADESLLVQANCRLAEFVGYVAAQLDPQAHVGRIKACQYFQIVYKLAETGRSRS